MSVSTIATINTINTSTNTSTNISTNTTFEWVDIFGYTATALCIASFLFQMYQIHKNRSAKDVSYGFIILQLLVNVLYTIYNIYNLNVPILINNATISVLTVIMLGQKYYFAKQNLLENNNIILDDILENNILDNNSDNLDNLEEVDLEN
jgi:uncharacterized protein with PQ loop repeat